MIFALLTLGISVAIGLVAHELSHAIALKWFRIPHEIEWLPDRLSSGLSLGFGGRLAVVSYHRVPSDLAPWKLRLSSLMPLLLTIPVIGVAVAGGAGLVVSEAPYLELAIIGWLACAIPSPADFAIFWHPQQSIAAGSAA